MNEETNNTTKTIVFNTTTSKKDIVKREKGTKRVVAEKWTFEQSEYAYENQLTIINRIYDNSLNYVEQIDKTVVQQINRKIYGYKQQDIEKAHFDESKFISLFDVVYKMIECALKCYYCGCEMNVLYDISREAKQWTVDRIDNDLGHNRDNFYIACLECNLKRRRRSDDKFLFTKQMKIVKVDDGEKI